MLAHLHPLRRAQWVRRGGPQTAAMSEHRRPHSGSGSGAAASVFGRLTPATARRDG